jgi:hypothetical protein
VQRAKPESRLNDKDRDRISVFAPAARPGTTATK